MVDLRHADKMMSEVVVDMPWFVSDFLTRCRPAVPAFSAVGVCPGVSLVVGVLLCAWKLSWDDLPAFSWQLGTKPVLASWGSEQCQLPRQGELSIPQ